MKGLFGGDYSQDQIGKVTKTLKARNRKRKIPVPDEVIDNFATRYVNFGRNVPDWVKVIDMSNREDRLKAFYLNKTPNMEQFNRPSPGRKKN